MKSISPQIHFGTRANAEQVLTWRVSYGLSPDKGEHLACLLRFLCMLILKVFLVGLPGSGRFLSLSY